MQHTLGEIADFLQAELKGDANYAITGIAPLDKARENQISFFGKAAGFAQISREHLAASKAGALILNTKDAETIQASSSRGLTAGSGFPASAGNDGKQPAGYTGNILLVEDPYLSYARLTELFNNAPKITPGIHDKAVIGKDVSIGKNVIIEAGCVIRDGAKIGDNCHLYPNVIIYHDVQIGSNVIIHSGAVIGADGFGFANNKGQWCKIHQLGSVQIGDNVEIGANTCIDRGALMDTIIENGVKIDNQVQIGHNVRIGMNTIIAGCTGIAGSTTIGRHCMIGGASNINGHINIADQVIITGTSTIARPITKPGIYSSGLEVQPHQKWLRTKILLLELANMLKRLRRLEEQQHA